MQTDQVGRGIAYYYGQIKKKEKKFYILCQDYSFGRAMADGFKKGLKEFYPEAEIVGEDYHKLFLTDFAPYLEKIKASGAEVIYTGDWIPDAANLLKQARQMGIKLPFAHIFLDEPNFLHEVGVEGTNGLVQLSQYGTENPAFKNREAESNTIKPGTTCGRTNGRHRLTTAGFSSTERVTSALIYLRPIGS